MIASYVPLRARDSSGDIVGVFEVYDDVTEFLRSIEHTERNISIGIAIGLAILYLLLIVVMRQSEKAITTHHDEDQQMLAEMKTVAEMLELRVAERTEALRRSEDQFKQAARTANLGHWTCNETERLYVDISEEYARIHGYTVDEMMSEFVTLDTHRLLIDPEDRERCLEAFESASPDNEFEIEYRIRRRDGAVRHVRRIGQFTTDDRNTQGTLPSGFDFEQGTQVGTGLELVKLLLPPESSSFPIRGQGHGVLAELRLDPPVVVAGTAKPVRANSHLIN